jgi:hypothetical protein
LSYINLDDQSIEQFGAAKMKDLGWEQIMDSYACIMFSAVRKFAPRITQAKLLSPAALEINKRYHFKTGGTTDVPMTESHFGRSGLGLHKLRRVRGHLPRRAMNRCATFSTSAEIFR